jgi:inosine triphosphate pyrophosphatase
MVKITIVTGNANKAKEFAQLLPESCEITNQKLDLDELQGTPEFIARRKAILAVNHFHTPVVVEDTSLYLKQYGEHTGAYCKWYGIGPDGKDDARRQCDNIYSMSVGCTDKTLVALCIIAYCVPDQEPILFRGEYEGTICSFEDGQPLPGQKFFGWDPIMWSSQYGKSFAQMTSDEKNSISHRKLAVDKFVTYMRNSLQPKVKPHFVLVTGNLKKKQEVVDILGHKFDITHRKHDCHEIQGTPMDIIKHKAQAAANEFQEPVVVEDTCLYLEAYGPCLGPYVKWFGTRLDEAGHVVDSAELQCTNLYNMSVGVANKKLIAISIFSYCEPGKEPIYSIGRFDGEICSLEMGRPADGSSYFGWDPIMWVPSAKKSFAQMTVDEKNAISHRRKALDQFVITMSKLCEQTA